jgi:hypothetical protein
MEGSGAAHLREERGAGGGSVKERTTEPRRHVAAPEAAGDGRGDGRRRGGSSASPGMVAGEREIEIGSHPVQVREKNERCERLDEVSCAGCVHVRIRVHVRKPNPVSVCDTTRPIGLNFNNQSNIPIVCTFFLNRSNTSN